MAMVESLPVGSALFGYEIQAVIGRGGMGTVYLARQNSLGRQVALKVLNPQRIRNQNQVEAFLREAQSAGRLNHPHLVLVHDAHVDAEKGLYCYSMEYVPGKTASKLVVERGTLSPSAALHIVYQIARALGLAHRSGLVHRDVKPDNILVTDSGVAKLADLGLVRDRLLGHAGNDTIGSQILTLVGTPDYSAPEQCRNPKRAGPASDVYSLGACLYFLLLGRPPFVGETVIDTIVRAATQELSLPAKLSHDNRQLLIRMLAKDPAKRFADGDAVVAALDALAGGKHIDVGEDDVETLHDAPAVEVPAPAPGRPAPSAAAKPRKEAGRPVRRRKRRH
jgi:eukaryotic-like serine/threonine-protein kinase